jgi:hypothetical protein
LTAESFTEAVTNLRTTNVTSPCYVIIGGVQQNEGQVITRDYDRTDSVQELTDEDWYVIKTNVDDD